MDRPVQLKLRHTIQKLHGFCDTSSIVQPLTAVRCAIPRNVKLINNQLCLSTTTLQQTYAEVWVAESVEHSNHAPVSLLVLAMLL